MAIDTPIASARRIPHVDVERASLAGLALILLGASLAFAALRIATPSFGSEIGGPGPVFTTDGVGVVTDPGYRGASPLVQGDVITALADRSMEGWAAALADPAIARPGLATGDAIPATLTRGGQPIAVVLMAGEFDALSALADDWGVLLLALSIQLVGAYLFARRPSEPAARALLVTGTGMFASTVPWALGLRATDLVGGLGFWLYAATAGLAYSLFWSGALHFALVFPRPFALVRTRRRLIAIAYLLPIGLQLALIAAAAIASGRALSALAAWLDGQALLQVASVTAAASLLVVNYRRLRDPVSRSQLRWVAGAVAVVAIGSLGLWFGPQLVIGEPLVPRSAVALLGLPFPLALGLAVSRHHLFDLDVVVNRSLVYGVLTGAVVLVYALTVGAVSGAIPAGTPFAASLLGAGAVAVVALPLRERLQHSVNRLMYGDRDEPERAIRRLGRRLEASLEPSTVLATLVETVAEALRSPYVAIEFERDGGATTQAAFGSQPVDAAGPRDLVRLPIIHQGRPIGSLAVAPRGPREPLSDADRLLLDDLARQAAPTIEAVRLTADLRRSREALVATREEERRRLRRDLHDGLGAGLAGSLMKLGAARSVIGSDPDRAARLLADLEADTRSSIEEIRRIAYDLRPPALDELGLAETIRQATANFDQEPAQARFHVSFTAPDALPPLPAAVEVAALRIVLEGLANAAHHSGGSRAWVSLTVNGADLVVVVADDGVGIPWSAPHGIGMVSMRERADELGGALQVLERDGGGTRLVVRLPIEGARA